MILPFILLIDTADGTAALAWFLSSDACEMVRLILSGHGISGACLYAPPATAT